MRSKREIVAQLEHLRTTCSNAGTPENETWVKALEWVLGDEAYQLAYAEYIANVRQLAGDLDSDNEDLSRFGRRSLALAMRLMLDRIT
jgi:hypothetical protein